MLTLRQLLYAKGSSGEALPAVWKSLSQAGTEFLRGQLCLVCAGPGTGKSAFALTYAIRARVPTLYFSADSDAFTQHTRALAILTGRTTAEAAAATNNGTVPEEEQKLLDSVPVRFDCDASPSMERLETSLLAYEELYGDFPHLTVVDNITNVRAGVDDDDPFSGLEVLLEDLHDMGRKTGSCFIGLHHVTGPHNDGNAPIPLSGIKGQIGRVPELILTLHRPPNQFGGELLNVSTVKNRAGKQDPTGKSFVSLRFDGERMRIEDM